jgi:hypothetical protein
VFTHDLSTGTARAVAIARDWPNHGDAFAELRIQLHVIEAVLNHVSGHKAGVAGIYNRARYAAEKRQALNRWSEHVYSLIEGAEPKVVPLRPRDPAASVELPIASLR